MLGSTSLCSCACEWTAILYKYLNNLSHLLKSHFVKNWTTKQTQWLLIFPPLFVFSSICRTIFILKSCICSEQYNTVIPNRRHRLIHIQANSCYCTCGFIGPPNLRSLLEECKQSIQLAQCLLWEIHISFNLQCLAPIQRHSKFFD